MSRGRSLVARLEKAERANADEKEILAILREVDSLEELWEIADRVVPYLPIVSAVGERARELGGSDERARGYLALAFLFEGEQDAAEEVLKGVSPSTTDSVLLQAWALSAETAQQRLDRLTEAIARADEPLRLWRDLHNVALLAGRGDKIAEAEAWLADHT